MSLRLFPWLLVLSVGCAHFHPAATPLLDPSKHPVSDNALEQRAQQTHFILIGEEHDNACDHQQQARLIRLLRPAVVGLEMVSVDAQPVLDQASQLGLDKLPQALHWQETWGVPFEIYKPVFQAALDVHARLVALNASKAIVHIVRDQGLEGLSPEQRVGITPQLIPPPADEEAMLRAAMEAHHGQPKSADADAMWQRFIRVQSFWDSQMAFRAAEASKNVTGPVVLIAGGGHVEHGWGIAERLPHFAPGATVLSIMPTRPAENFDPQSADLFFQCPSSPAVAQR